MKATSSFAIFAKGYKPSKEVPNRVGQILDPVYAVVPDWIPDPSFNGLVDADMMLIVGVLAPDEGVHTCIVTHSHSGLSYKQPFPISPQDYHGIAIPLNGPFPVHTSPELVVNEYPISIDGEYVATARVLSVTR